MGVVSAQREVLRFAGMGGCVDELHPKYSGRFHGDVTTVFAICGILWRNLRQIGKNYFPA
jgi:hypothetical protein